MLFVLFFLTQAGIAPLPDTSLQEALAHANPSKAEALIEAGVSVNSLDSHGRTPLHVAASADGPKERLICLLLSKGADPNARDDEGASPLDNAAWRGDVNRVALLLDGGAEINARETKTGATPLNEAAFKGHIGVVELLLEHGADKSIRDNAGFSPVDNTLREHHPDVMSIFLKHHRNSSLLTHLLERAVRSCQEGIASNLLDCGVPIDGHFASGSTALWDASLNGVPQLFHSWSVVAQTSTNVRRNPSQLRFMRQRRSADRKSHRRYCCGEPIQT